MLKSSIRDLLRIRVSAPTPFIPGVNLRTAPPRLQPATALSFRLASSLTQPPSPTPTPQTPTTTSKPTSKSSTSSTPSPAIIKRPATKGQIKNRQAAASSQLRTNPPPTRGPVLECIAYSTADKYNLDILYSKLKTLGISCHFAPSDGDMQDKDKAIVLSVPTPNDPLIDSEGVRLPSQDFWSRSGGFGSTDDSQGTTIRNLAQFGSGGMGEIWIFKSGSFVTWGLTKSQGQDFLHSLIRGGGNPVIESGKYKQIQSEEVDFVVDPTKETLIKGDLILLGTPPVLTAYPNSPIYAGTLTRYTLSLALTRSSALSAIEAALDSHLSSVSKLPKILSEKGSQPLSRTEVIKKIGELMLLREAVNFRGGGLEDIPDIYWSEPVLESYFDAVTKEFELSERVDNFNQKVDYANEVQSTLRALLTESSGHRMELIIIALIAVEVIVVMIREGPELYEKGKDWVLWLLFNKAMPDHDYSHSHRHGHGSEKMVGSGECNCNHGSDVELVGDFLVPKVKVVEDNVRLV